MEENMKKAFGRLLIILALSGFSFAVLMLMVNYMTLATAVWKMANPATISADYYHFKASYMYNCINEKVDAKMFPIMAALLGLIVFWRVGKRLAMLLHKTPDVEDSSRWATEKEIKKMFCKVDSNNLSAAKKSGIILYRKGRFLYVDTETINSLIIGTTRSGKGQTFVLPMIRVLSQGQQRQSMILNDPKGELLENAYKMLISAGYKVVVLNFRDTNFSSLWNPLAPIIKEFVAAQNSEEKDVSKVSELIGELAGVFTDNPKSDPIWPTSAKSLLSAMIWFLLSAGYENDCLDKLNLYSVYNFFLEFGVKNDVEMINGQPIKVNALDKLFQQLPIGAPAKLAYSTSNFATGDMRSSIFSTLANNLEIFSDTGIAKLTSGNEIDFEDLTNPQKPCAIFMVVPDEKVNRHVLASLFVNQCYSALVDLASGFPGQKLPQRIQFILDEFGNMVRIPAMDVKLTVCLGRNILFNLFVQDLNQLQTKYQDSSKTLRSNCGNLVYINSIDKDTNEYISDVLGSNNIEYDTYSGSLDESLSHQNVNIKSRKLKTAAELSVLKFGEAITKRQRCYPIITRFKPFYKLKIPVTPIAEIMGGRKRKLTEWMFPLEVLTLPKLPKISKELQALVALADEHTNKNFSYYLSEEQYGECKKLINNIVLMKVMSGAEVGALAEYVKGLAG